MMLKIKKVSRKLQDYAEIVKLMKTAFPKNEQFPMWLLRLLACKKSIDFTAYYDEELFAGVSYTAMSDNMIFILFLAVNSNIRSKGYGTAILEHIKKNSNGKTITLNIEPVIESAENYEQRKSRLLFYERNGFNVTEYMIEDNGENYLILSNTSEYSIADFKEVIKKMSFGLYNPKVHKR